MPVRKPYATRVHEVDFGGGCIYGELRVPRGADSPLPLVICSHYFGGNHVTSGEWADLMARAGLASYAFDFRGGSPESRSSGDTTEMTVGTEAADVEAIMDDLAELPEIDERNVFLLGQSQGGVASALAAARRPERTRGLMLLYPAFTIHHDMTARFGNPERVPEHFNWWMRLGRAYGVEAIEHDYAKEASSYPGPVLVFHGDADDIAPIEHTRRYAELTPNAELEVVHGAGHGFFGAQQEGIAERLAEFVRAHLA